MRLPFQAPPTVLMVLVVIAALVSAKLADAETVTCPGSTAAQIDPLRSAPATAAQPQQP
ncbi:hypothetical protein [Roseobacter sinensis]|uniref:Uncharacterized protein n=1 Tax=Roseobacter sinensis TaxID=2931391 RepID=A0ABT3BBS0_9RHOB|nr:hypothetical protein [Roseobacter sp. WL0113]MCV3270563.1 hypothetical protein [Roseobacter sp. WL0113]